MNRHRAFAVLVTDLVLSGVVAWSTVAALIMAAPRRSI